MNQACVSLEEVLAAASARAASLVPETSGYLALAVADATSRLPYAHEDRGVLLTIDGSVMVPRKAPIAAPPEAARVLRDLLRRLLAVSTGSMPGLASAARARGEEHDVDRVVGDIEAALIPVNRAAAKRALARLSRETLRAKELGKLKKKSAPPPAQVAAAASAKGPPAPARPPVEAPPPAPKSPDLAPTLNVAPQVIAAPPAPAPVHVAPQVIAAPPAPVHVAPPALVVAPPPHVEAAEAAAPILHVERAPEIAPPPLVVAVSVAAALSEVHAFTPTPFEIDVEMSAAPAGDYLTGVIPDLGTDAPPPASNATPAPDAPNLWADNDATIADPEAMAVIESIYREGHLAEGAPDLESDAATGADAALHEARAVSPSPDDAILTRPMHAAVTTSAIPRDPQPLQIVMDDASQRPALRPMERAIPDPLTAEAGPVALLAQLSSSRADELLDAFHPEDQGDRAVLAAASSLRAFAGVEEPSSQKPAVQRPTFLRVPPPARRAGPALPDIDDDLPLPAPRARHAAPTRWPIALFAVGVLVLFAAWLYRPTLAHDFFGLTTLLRSAVAPAAETHAAEPAPATAPTSEPAEPPAAPETPAAIPPRSRDARAATASGDGARRRRD